ncbi:sigma-70 family RNA polymerase sigma factor, partial [Planctomycetota bacterium]
AARDDESRHINRVLQELPFEQYEVLILKFYHDMPYEEIAQMLGAPVKTCQSRYRYALEKLREKLKNV